MPEKKGVTSSACKVVLVILTLLVGENSAAIENPECYAGCLLCAGGGFWISVAWCSLCVASCYADSPSLVSVPKDNYYFCRLGCASSLCGSFINEQDPTSAIEKVGGCVDSCSEKCSTARSLPHD